MNMRKRKKCWRVALLIVSLLLGVCFLLGLGAVSFLIPYSNAKMDMSLVRIYQANEPSVFYAYAPENRAGRDGDCHVAPKSALVDSDACIYTAYGDMPSDLINAFVAIEDKRFWQHDGVDLLRTGRAGLAYLRGNATFGGSTITQQLVKNLTGKDEHSLDRKLNEIFTAFDLEKQLSKTEILEAYLNVINLAEGCYGVGAAAKRYFSKSVTELSLAECATIAAITKNPSGYDPILCPENNLLRRNIILREMEKQGYITETERDEAIQSPLGLNPTERSVNDPVTSWYIDMVIRDVIRDLQEKYGYSYDKAAVMIYKGGLTIETAMDESLQRILEAYYAKEDHFPQGEYGRPQSACILIDPYTGDILAVAGAVGEKNANRIQNYAVDTRRPAGSCIKPLSVYAPALERGLITWASILEDEPLLQKDGKPWPSNADGIYRGRVSAGKALAHSINTVSVRILNDVGCEQSFAFLHDRLGLESLVSPTENTAHHDATVSSLALGQQSRGLSVRELTAAYSVFIDGIYRAPISYHRVLDSDGNVLLENPPFEQADRVLSAENAALMTQMLCAVTQEGTAAPYMAELKSLGIDAAGKTGTTQNNCDRWFVGYTPRMLAGVWMGYDYPIPMKGIRGNLCVSVWDELMAAFEKTYQGRPTQSVFESRDLLLEMKFCPLTGKRLNEFCEDPVYGVQSELGWFVRGTEPMDRCDLHEEPPIPVIPASPDDPNRIPLLPNDILQDENEYAPPIENHPRRKYFPWHFFRHRLFD